jgi:cell division protein FtsN
LTAVGRAGRKAVRTANRGEGMARNLLVSVVAAILITAIGFAISATF